MIIYQASLDNSNKNIKINEIEAENYGDKLLKFENGHIIHVNDIGYYNNEYDSTYGYTKEDAVNTIKNEIIEKIEEQKRYIKRLKEKLNYPLKEVALK